MAAKRHYDIARKALEKLGPNAVIALRHLKTNRQVTFGTFPPQSLPQGMSADTLHKILRACAAEGLVAQAEKHGLGEQTFQIAPTMDSVLGELLYES